MKINKVIIQVIIQVAAWLCFLMLPFAFMPRPKEGPFIPEQYISFYFLLSSFLYISFYYINFYVLIPKLFQKKRLLYYMLLIIGLLIFFGTFHRTYRYFSDHLLHLPPIPWQTRGLRKFSPPLLSAGSIAIFLLVFAISTGIRMVTQWFDYERKNREIENEKLSTELSYLKSQINPHFLFNTLNNIYSLAEAGSNKTAPSVMKLSSIMRYVLTEAKNNEVPLEKEIQFTQNYIELQKMRLTDKSTVDFVVTGDYTGKKISPLIFLPFVENAFKYGVSTREISPIQISLDIKDTEIDFSVMNNKYPHSLLKPAETTGIGIGNIKRRLELLYQNKYQLILDDEPSTYSVNLNLHL